MEDWRPLFEMWGSRLSSTESEPAASEEDHAVPLHADECFSDPVNSEGVVTNPTVTVMREKRPFDWQSLFRSCWPTDSEDEHDDDDCELKEDNSGWSFDFERQDSVLQDLHEAKETIKIKEDASTALCTDDEDCSFYTSNEYESHWGEVLEDDDEFSFHTAKKHDSYDDDESDLEDPTSPERHSLEPSEPDEKQSNASNYRFLFNKYWMQQQRGTRDSPVVPSQICIPSPKTEEPPQFRHAARSKKSVGVQYEKKLNTQPQDRRSIFGLCLAHEEEEDYCPKNMSAIVQERARTETLSKGNVSSSLRPCRYSGEFRRSSSGASGKVKRSVSFSNQAQISVYERPVEQYDNNGWQSIFS